jgi:MFS family permease
VFFQPFVREFHIGRAAVSLAFTIHNLVSGVSAVVIGRMADRIGARTVILPGLGIVAALLFSAKAIGSSLWELYLFYIALGVVGSATTTVPYTLVVSRWFDRSRGLALGGMMVGLGVGAVVMPVVAQRLIASFGWRNAFAIVGCAMLTVPCRSSAPSSKTRLRRLDCCRMEHHPAVRRCHTGPADWMA